MFTETQRISCPYCGEAIEIEIDTSIETQSYIEDCSVCCRPIEITVSVTNGEISISARSDDE